MPNAITHFLIAQDAAQRLPRSYADMPSAAPDYYFIGSQGGDPLFFYKPLSPLSWRAFIENFFRT